MSARSDYDAMNNSMKGLASNGYLKKKDNANDDTSAYKEEEFVPPSNIPFNVGDGENYDYDKKPIKKSETILDYIQQDLNKERYEESPRPDEIDEQDEQVFDNGPNKSEVESWKKQFDSDIYIVDDLPGDVIYIYRTLNRYEYKAIMATPNTDPLMREEMMCEQCVLFPYEYSYGQMASGNAGVVTVIAQHIMETSGFTRASMPRRL